MLIDSHTHLQLVNFNKDRDEVIQRALDAGVQEMINVSFDIPSSHASLSLARKYPFMKAAVGIHPHEAKGFDQNSLEALRSLASSQKVVAIGEIGLDYYRDLSPKETQKEVFKEQLHLAKELALPVIFHTREAYSDLLHILEEEGIDGGVLHCFSGNSEDVKGAIDLGLFFGIGGMVTYKNTNLPSLLTQIGLNRLILETDCPFLTPHPHKGRNEPAYLTTTCQKVSEILGLSFEKAAKQTSENVRTLFHI